MEDKDKLSDTADAANDPSSEVSSRLLKVPGDVFADLFEGAVGEVAVSSRDFGERYSFKDVLGEGGQGVVVRAHDSLLHRDVAIKALKKRHDTAHEKMLEHEAVLCGRLEHPNILPTYDLVYDEAHSPLFVMKKIEGRTLDDLLNDLRRSGGLVSSRLRLLNIFLQVLNAMDFAHSRKVLHLDLKPGNISLGSFGEVYVIDWGFASLMDGTAQKLAGGTMHYMSPERIERKGFDERADIFSLGVMLYRLMTGRHPRDVGDIDNKEYKEKYKEFPVIEPRERDRTIAPELAAIIMKAMSDDPQQRYRGAHEFAVDLIRFMEMSPVSAYDEGVWGLIRRYYRKHKRGVVAAFVAAALLIITIAAVWQQQQSERHRAQVEQEKIALQKARTEADNRQREATRKRYGARRILDRALDLFEKTAPAVEAQSDPARKQALLKPALEKFDEAIMADSSYAEAYERRARAHQLGFMFEKSLRDYQKAFELDSSYIMSLYEAGMLLADVFKQPERAREKFRQMQEISPDDEYALLGQARVDLVEADRFLKLKPESADYDKRLELAEAVYERVLERCGRIEQANAALSDVWYIRGLVYQKSPKLKDAKKALAAYDKYLASRRDSPSAFHNRGDARKDLGDYDGAIADYSEALSINPEFIWSMRNRGYLLYRYKNEPEKALVDINRAIELAPDNYWSYVDRGAVYGGMGKYARAVEEYKKALKLSADDAGVYYRLGVGYVYLQQPEVAGQYFTMALKHSPESRQALTLQRRGAVRLASGQYADAVRDFETAVRLDKEGAIYSELMRFLALKFSGLPIDEAEFGASLLAPEDKPWLSALGSYFLGEARESDVLRLASDPFAQMADKNLAYYGEDDQKALLLKAKNLAAVCQVRFYLGCYALSSGERKKANGHFQAAIDTGEHLYLEYALSRFFLKKVEK